MTHISLLGEQQVRSGAGDPPVALPGRAGALLAFLVLHEGTHEERSRLALLFWPHSTEAQARTNLRRELHRLRAVLGPAPSLVVTDTALAWNDRPECSVDVLEFRASRRAALACDRAGDVPGLLAHAERALSLYRGELLPGIRDDWLAPEREELRREHLELVLRTAAARRSAGDSSGAAELARRHIDLEPLDEAAYRLLMEVQAAAGQRAEAMSTYHRCASVLERDLEVLPGPAITEVFERLVVGERPAAATPVGPARTGPRSPVAAGPASTARPVRLPVAPLVGRARELAALQQAWEHCAGVAPGFVLVRGDPGVGKSRLAAALAREAQRDGAVVATARCFRGSGRSALAPVAQWLRSPGLVAGGLRLDELWRAEIGRLVPPALRADGLGDGADRPGTRNPVEAWGRRRFSEALVRAVRAPSGPVLLVLDDVQWCDAETLAWLPQCLAHPGAPGLMVLGTARTQELESRPDIDDHLRSMRAAGLLQELVLGPLDGPATAELAARTAGRALLPGEARAVHAATAGYPLHVVEAGRRMRAAGGRPEAMQFSDLRGVLDRRLREPSPAARETAQLASAVGRDFGLDLLLEAGRLRSDQLVGAVDELWRLRILRTNGTTYAFTHELLREAACRSVSPAQRWLLHRRLAEALERLHPGRPGPVPAQLAEHWERGGRQERAVECWEQAAEAAADVYASSESMAHLRRALRVVREWDPGAGRDEAELRVLLRTMAPLTSVQGYASPELLTVLERAVTLARARGEKEIVVSCLVAQFAVRFVQGRASAADASARAALRESADVPGLAGQAHFAMGGAAVARGRHAEALRHFAVGLESVPTARPYVLGTDLDVHGRAWAAHAHWFLGDEDQAVASSDGALRRARAAEHPFSLAVALGYAAVLHQLRGDTAATRRTAHELAGVCGRYDIAYYSEWALVLEGATTSGPAGTAMIRRGIDRLRSGGAFARMPYWLALLAEALDREGRPEDAAGVLDAAAATAAHDERCWLPLVQQRRARLRRCPGPHPGANGGRTPGS